MPNPKIFNQLLICTNLYQHAKNQLISSVESWDQFFSILSGEIVHLKTMQSVVGWEHFVLYLKNKIFPKYKICTGTQQIINIFILEQIQWKLMTNFLFKLKTTYFWSISPIFGTKEFFHKDF